MKRTRRKSLLSKVAVALFCLTLGAIIGVTSTEIILDLKSYAND